MGVTYGLTQTDIKHYRWLLSLGKPHDYLMIHLAQTYRTRKVVYDNGARSHNDSGVLPYPHSVPQRLSQGS